MPVAFICIFVFAWQSMLKGRSLQNGFQLDRATAMFNNDAVKHSLIKLEAQKAHTFAAGLDTSIKRSSAVDTAAAQGKKQEERERESPVVVLVPLHVSQNYKVIDMYEACSHLSGQFASIRTQEQFQT